MCFTEEQSYIHFILLLLGGLYVYPNIQLSVPLIFFSIIDLIQGLSYRNIRIGKSTKFLTTLSWILICFQPLMINIFMSDFDKNFKYWNVIFIICFIGALYGMTFIEELDIQNEPNCLGYSNNDYCQETSSYLGKYHIGYRFNLDKHWDGIIYYLWYIFMTVPCLFTKSRNLGILWIIFTLLTFSITNYFIKNNNGEKAAIWCYLGVLIALPAALFHKQIKKHLL